MQFITSLLLFGTLLQAPPPCPMTGEVVSFAEKVTVRQYTCAEGAYIVKVLFHRAKVLQVVKEVKK